MANAYVGFRYVPLFCGVWDNSKGYEGQSYTLSTGILPSTPHNCDLFRVCMLLYMWRYIIRGKFKCQYKLITFM